MRRLRLRVRRAVASLAAALLGLASPSLAQPLGPDAARPLGPAAGAPVPPATPGAGSARLTAPDLEAWLDGYMPYALQRGAIPGAVVVVVKDGRVLLEKGYGVSDVARATAVDPRTTGFRVGSVSKLFTWTAVMQLVEQGRLNIDADVNGYLDFRLPARPGRRITLRDLMTHTAGFEEAVRGIATEDPRGVPSLGAALKAAVPRRVYDPGTTPAYSNYGAALAGYVVERVSGEPFEAYVTRHILQPLGMTRSSFAQPLPPALTGTMSKGYLDAGRPPQLYEQVVWRPAGALTTTGDDMARFMLAHLQDGRLGDARILRPETARRMHTEALTLLAPLKRMDLGFYELDLNGRRAVGHDGDTVLFHAHLGLYLDEGVGLFLALNGAGRSGAANAVRSGLVSGFADRYFPPAPAPAPPPAALATADAHDRLLAGEYTSSRSFSGSFLAALNMLLPIRVTANPDATVSVSGVSNLGGAPRRFRETAPYVWRQIDGGEHLAAQVRSGRVVRFSYDEVSPFQAYSPTPAWRSSALLPPTGVAFVVVLLTALAWPVRAAWRLWRRTAAVGRGGRSRTAVAAAAWVALGAAAGWTWVLSLLMTPRGVFQLGDHDLAVQGVQLLTVTGVVLGLAASFWRLVIVARAPASWAARVGSVAFALSTLMLTWFAAAGHLLGFGTHF